MTRTQGMFADLIRTGPYSNFQMNATWTLIIGSARVP